MRRFDYDDDDDYREDVDNFFDGEEQPDITPEEYRSLIEDEQVIQQLQIEMVSRELNDRLMFKAIKMLEKSFWWRFYSLDTRLKMIEKTFNKMKSISEDLDADL